MAHIHNPWSIPLASPRKSHNQTLLFFLGKKPLHFIQHLDHILVLLALVIQLDKVCVAETQRFLGVLEIHTQFLDSTLRVSDAVDDSAVGSDRGVESLVRS